MKGKKKIILYILIIFFILAMLAWSFPIYGQTNNEQSLSDVATPTPAMSLSVSDSKLIQSESISAGDFGLSESKMSSGNPFYFIKDLSWGVKKFFAFGQTSKAKVELKQLNQKSLELRNAVNDNLGEKVVEKSILRYEKSLLTFEKRLSGLDVNNAKFGLFLDWAVNDVLLQEKVLNEVNYLAQSDSIQAQLNALTDKSWKLLVSLGEKSGDFAGFQKIVLNKVFTIGDNKIFGSFTTAEILEKLSYYLNISSSDFDLFKTDFYIQVQTELHNAEQLLKNKLPYILRGIFGQKVSEQKTLRELEERSGQREFFEILGLAIGEEIVSVAEYDQCLREADLVEQKFNEFEDSVSKVKLSSNVSGILKQVEAHLEQARITSLNQVKTVCNLVSGASVLLDAAKTLIAQEANGFEGDLSLAQSNLADTNEKIKNYSSDEFFRVFDLANQMQMQIEAMMLAREKNKTELFLREKNKFDLILSNVNHLIEFIDSQNYNKLVSSLVVDRGLLSKNKINEFDSWCQKQNGGLAENFGILPICLINEKMTTMLEWHENL